MNDKVMLTLDEIQGLHEIAFHSGEPLKMEIMVGIVFQWAKQAEQEIIRLRGVLGDIEKELEEAEKLFAKSTEHNLDTIGRLGARVEGYRQIILNSGNPNLIDEIRKVYGNDQTL